MSNPERLAPAVEDNPVTRALKAQQAGPVRRAHQCSECRGDLTPIDRAGRYFAGVCGRCADRRRLGIVRSGLDRVVERIPKRFREMRLDTAAPHPYVKRPAAVAEAKSALGRKETLTILLRGGAGKGKSSIAAALLRDVIDAGRPEQAARALVERAAGVMWLDAPTIGAAPDESKLGTQPAAIREASLATVLVVDELGREQAPNEARHADPLFRVLLERHQQARLTIVTTWLTREQLGQKYDGGMARRLLEEPAAAFIDCDGAAR